MNTAIVVAAIITAPWIRKGMVAFGRWLQHRVDLWLVGAALLAFSVGCGACSPAPTPYTGEPSVNLTVSVSSPGWLLPHLDAGIALLHAEGVSYRLALPEDAVITIEVADGCPRAATGNGVEFARTYTSAPGTGRVVLNTCPGANLAAVLGHEVAHALGAWGHLQDGQVGLMEAVDPMGPWTVDDHALLAGGGR